MITLIKTLQKALGVTVDGKLGPVTLAALARRLSCVPTWTACQEELEVKADGIFGVKSLRAALKALEVEAPPAWPTQALVRTGVSDFGRAGDESNLVSVIPPYTLYYEGKAVKTISVHRLIARHVRAALEEVLAAYGPTEIRRLGLDQYSGCYNYRATASGKTLSMHAWGIALDFSADGNAFSTHAPKATLSHPDCRKWWEIWESHGAVSLGRERDYDWMHLQFAALS